jgi:ribonuclease-3
MKKILQQLDIDIDLLPPKKRNYFVTAFTHRSTVHDATQYQRHNERLEFLGDAVLELAVTEQLFADYNEESEGILTSYRSALVRGDNLAKVARDLDLGKYLIISESESRSGGRDNDSLLANVLEALIGAMYLVRGKKFATDFILKYVYASLDVILAASLHIDAKSHFQELSQDPRIGITPHYITLSESGKDHQKEFVMAAYLGEQKVGEGSGGSKKEAQVEAARDALSRKDEWLH